MRPVGRTRRKSCLSGTNQPAVEVTDAEWQQTFAALVNPLLRLVRAVKVNAIAQNLVDNPTYFPEEIQRNPLVAVYQPVADL